MDSKTLECADCGTPLGQSTDTPSDDRRPCPACGSTAARIHVRGEDLIQVHDSLAVKVKRGGVGKPVKTAKHGDFYHHDTGKWNHIDQVLDRENDVYIKRIVDGDTGEVIRDDHGRLSDHQGFGDAKRRGDGT